MAHGIHSDTGTSFKRHRHRKGNREYVYLASSARNNETPAKAGFAGEGLSLSLSLFARNPVSTLKTRRLYNLPEIQITARVIKAIRKELQTRRISAAASPKKP